MSVNPISVRYTTPLENMPCSAPCSALQDRYMPSKTFTAYGATLLLQCYTPLLLHPPPSPKRGVVAGCSVSMKEKR